MGLFNRKKKAKEKADVEEKLEEFAQVLASEDHLQGVPSIFDDAISTQAPPVKAIKSENLGVLSNFLNLYPPSSALQAPSADLLQRMQGVLPEEILNFWQMYGFGSYGNGIIKVVNPDDYQETFDKWVDSDAVQIPLFVTAFGNVIYYGKESPQEEKISVLDIHHGKNGILATSIDEFFGSFIQNKEVMNNILYSSLYEQAVNEKGTLGEFEIFYFVPALILAGDMDIGCIDKGDGRIHQDVLLRIGEMADMPE